MEKYTLSKQYHDEFESQKWISEIPSINFPSDWLVQIIPPITGAVIRFRINDNISVYLDCYDLLGIVGFPYWEIYPNQEGCCSRYHMNDVEGLLSGIKKSLTSHG